eukprot:6112907-Prymnesium_polylepis.1
MLVTGTAMWSSGQSRHTASGNVGVATRGKGLGARAAVPGAALSASHVFCMQSNATVSTKSAKVSNVSSETNVWYIGVGARDRHADNDGAGEAEREGLRREALLDRQHPLAEAVGLVDPRLDLRPVVQNLWALAGRASMAVCVAVVLVRLVLAAARLAVRRE